jgi:hypothetical protein
LSQGYKNLLAVGILIVVVFIVWGIEMLRATFRLANLFLAFAVMGFVALIMLLFAHFAHAYARDVGQWENSDPAVVEWYQSLMQPDNPQAPCCGEADAYFADEVHVRDGRTYAVITDDRPDEPRKRPHIDIGTEFEVPDSKLKWDKSNPTGHGVIFVSRWGSVYCFVQGGGA